MPLTKLTSIYWHPPRIILIFQDGLSGGVWPMLTPRYPRHRWLGHWTLITRVPESLSTTSTYTPGQTPPIIIWPLVIMFKLTPCISTTLNVQCLSKWEFCHLEGGRNINDEDSKWICISEVLKEVKVELHLCILEALLHSRMLCMRF